MERLNVQGGHRLQGLDAMRGLAVLMVVIAHFFSAYMPTEAVKDVVHSLGIGGVVFFFNLSGYLVYKSINEIAGGSFVCRRAAKIFPAYWFSIAIYFTLSLFNQYDQVPLPVYASNILLIQEVMGGVLIFGHFWTLAVEVKFYAIVAVLAPTLRKYFVPVTILLIAALNTAFYLKTGRGSTLFTNLPIFFGGVLVYYASKSDWQRRDKMKIGLYLLLVPASMIFFQQYNGIEYAIYVAIAVFALCLSLLQPLKSRILSYFGRISYSLYLLHPIIGFRVEALLNDAELPRLVATMVAIASSVALADLGYRFVEVPGVRLGRKLEGSFYRKIAIAG